MPNLSVNVLRDEYGDAAPDTLTLALGPDWALHCVSYPAVRIVAGNTPGTLKAITIFKPEGHVLGPMMTGNHIGSSDRRFAQECERVLAEAWGGHVSPNDSYAIDGTVALHTRYETPAQYRTLST